MEINFYGDKVNKHCNLESKNDSRVAINSLFYVCYSINLSERSELLWT